MRFSDFAAFKAWYNPKTNKSINMSYYDRHFEVAKRNRKRMGIGDATEANIAAVTNGWARVSSKMEGQDVSRGYVTANSLDTARATLDWMNSAHYLPDEMEVEIYTNGQPTDHIVLIGKELTRFLRHGTLPRS